LAGKLVFEQGQILLLSSNLFREKFNDGVPKNLITSFPKHPKHMFATEASVAYRSLQIITMAIAVLAEVHIKSQIHA